MKGKRFKEEQIIRILHEAEGGLTVAEVCHKHYNTKPPYSAPGYRAPAPEVMLPNEKKEVMGTGQIAA